MAKTGRSRRNDAAAPVVLDPRARDGGGGVGIGLVRGLVHLEGGVARDATGRRGATRPRHPRARRETREETRRGRGPARLRERRRDRQDSRPNARPRARRATRRQRRGTPPRETTRTAPTQIRPTRVARPPPHPPPPSPAAAADACSGVDAPSPNATRASARPALAHSGDSCGIGTQNVTARRTSCSFSEDGKTIILSVGQSAEGAQHSDSRGPPRATEDCASVRAFASVVHPVGAFFDASPRSRLRFFFTVASLSPPVSPRPA